MQKKFLLTRRVLYRGLEGMNLIADITWREPYTKIVEIDGERVTKRFPASKTEGARLNLENNAELLEKIKSIPRRRLIWITYTTEVALGNQTENITIVKVMKNDEYMALKKTNDEKQKQLKRQNEKVYIKSLKKR